MGDWRVILLTGGSVLIAMLLTGAPVFVAFLILSATGVFFIIGPNGFGMVANSLFDATNSASLSAIPLFILMGELLFRSGAVDRVFESMDRLVGRVRSRQFVLCFAISTIFGALSGAAMGVAAMMARSLYPGMLSRGYDERLSIGSILAGASLAPIIPPSILVIIIGTLANVSIAGLLVSGIIPGLMLATMFMGYTVLRVSISPSLAGPEAEAEERTKNISALAAIANLLPFSGIIFSVMGLILLGIATPSESAGTGVVGALLTVLWYQGRIELKALFEALYSAAYITSMILIIMACSKMFSQLLAFTGATSQMTSLITSLDWHPMLMLLVMLAVPFIFCMFMDQIALMLIVIPIYQPLLAQLGFDPIWFWLLMLLNVTVGGITPPFGYTMFAFKGAAPDTQLSTIFASTWPFVAIFLVGMAVIAFWPRLATWLPSMI